MILEKGIVLADPLPFCFSPLQVLDSLNSGLTHRGSSGTFLTDLSSCMASSVYFKHLLFVFDCTDLVRSEFVISVELTLVHISRLRFEFIRTSLLIFASAQRTWLRHTHVTASMPYFRVRVCQLGIRALGCSLAYFAKFLTT